MPRDRLDPRLGIVATAAFVVGVVLTPSGRWAALAIEAALLMGTLLALRVDGMAVLRRWLGFLPLVVFLALVIAPGHRDRAALGWPTVALSIVAKNALAFAALATLSVSIPQHRLLAGLGRLGVPSVLVSTLHFTLRYLHVLSEETSRMLRSIASRTFRRGRFATYAALSGLIGVLFVRAMERGERVHGAMLARGWNGSMPGLDDGAAER